MHAQLNIEAKINRHKSVCRLILPMSKNILSRLRPELQALSAYQVTDASGMVKLDAMENPYQWSDEINAAWLQYLSHAAINRYPEPDPEDLKQQLKQRFGPEHEDIALLLGNGSDELIQLLVLAVSKPDASVLTVVPSFSMYQLISQMLGIDCHCVPLDDNFQLDQAAMLAAIEQYDPALIFLAYPNNPTANLWSRDDLEQILQASQGLVVIDEAYGPFASDSFVEQLPEYPNMLVLRTASKLGLAGLRFGWLAANRELIAELNKLRLPYNINLLTQMTMQFALQNYLIFARQAERICQSRTKLVAGLAAMPELIVFPSEANFLLIRLKNQSADHVFSRVLSQKVLIKNVSKQAGLAACLRVTVGTEDENQALLEAFRYALSE